MLVHAATGGVGLLAVDWATGSDCLVYATAGRAQKQQFLRSKGICLISSTRDAIRFQEEIAALGYGHKMLDAVLNSLTHETYIPTSVGLLRVFEGVDEWPHAFVVC